jgi:hypothetical protein
MAKLKLNIFILLAGAPSIGGSSSQRSSTGPSNNTGSTQLSSHMQQSNTYAGNSGPYSAQNYNTYNGTQQYPPSHFNIQQLSMRSQQCPSPQRPNQSQQQPHHHVMGTFHADGKVSNI